MTTTTTTTTTEGREAGKGLPMSAKKSTTITYEGQTFATSICTYEEAREAAELFFGITGGISDCRFVIEVEEMLFYVAFTPGEPGATPLPGAVFS